MFVSFLQFSIFVSSIIGKSCHLVVMCIIAVAFGELSDPAVTLALLVGSESIRSYLNERLFADFVL